MMMIMTAGNRQCLVYAKITLSALQIYLLILVTMLQSRIIIYCHLTSKKIESEEASDLRYNWFWMYNTRTNSKHIPGNEQLWEMGDVVGRKTIPDHWEGSWKQRKWPGVLKCVETWGERNGWRVPFLNILSRKAQIPNGSCILSAIIEHNSVAGCGIGSRMCPLPGFQKLLHDSRKGRVTGRQKSVKAFLYFSSIL